MLENLIASQGMLSMGFTTKLMVCILISISCGKRKRIWIAFFANIIHFFIYNVLTLGILNSIYGEELWFRFIVATMGTGVALCVAVILSIVWEVHFFKLLTVYICSDAFVAMIVYIAGFLCPSPSFIFVFGMVSLGVFLFFGLPFLKKIRNIYFFNSWLLGGFLLTVLINSWLSNILYVWTEDMLVSDIMIFFGVGQILISLTFIFLECLVYIFIQKRKQAMLLRNKAQMEDYYRQVSKHLREIDETRILLGRGTKLLAAAHQEQQDSMELSPKELDPKELQTYLSRLKNQYEALGEVFFCNDFAIDSVLRDFVISCRQKGIGTDILFHEYKRGKVAAGDAAAILSRMLDYGQRAAEPLLQSRNTRPGQASQQSAGVCISLHGASVKNQLLFSMTVTVAEPGAWDVDGKQSSGETVRTLRKIRVKKRSFNPWMRKYNGIIHVQWEGQQMQLVVGLNNGEEQDKRE